MSFWSTLTGTTPQSEQEAELADEKAKYQAALDRRVTAGTISADASTSDQSFVNGVQLDSTDSAAWAGFQEGAAAGLQNVLNAPGQVVGAAGNASGTLLGGILKNIPWWVWLGAAVYFYVTLGGGLRSLKKLL